MKLLFLKSSIVTILPFTSVHKKIKIKIKIKNKKHNTRWNSNMPDRSPREVLVIPH
jgi:hypothetical protein